MRLPKYTSKKFIMLWVRGRKPGHPFTQSKSFLASPRMAWIIMQTRPTKVSATRTYGLSANSHHTSIGDRWLTTHMRASPILIDKPLTPWTSLRNLLYNLLALLLRFYSTSRSLHAVFIASHVFVPWCLVVKAWIEAAWSASYHRMLWVFWVFFAVVAFRAETPPETGVAL